MNRLKRIILSIIFLFLLSPPPLFAARPAAPPPCRNDSSVELDPLLDDAISRGLIAGGVVLIGNRDGVLLEHAYGKASTVPGCEPMAMETIFDIASLTKVVATTPAILQLAESHRLSLVDPLVKWFPEFAGKGKDDLLIMNLLTHTSGLDDFPLRIGQPGRKRSARSCRRKKPWRSGEPLQICRYQFYSPGRTGQENRRSRT